VRQEIGKNARKNAVKIKIRKSRKTTINEVDFDNLEFGVHLSDHMYYVDYADGHWGEPRIEPYGPMKMYPALSTLLTDRPFSKGSRPFSGSMERSAFSGPIRTMKDTTCPVNACASPPSPMKCSSRG
jgi:branched-chain amino acid aminotransferase